MGLLLSVLLLAGPPLDDEAGFAALVDGLVELSADRLTAELSRGRIVGLGHVSLRVGGATLTADRVTINLREGRVEAEGNVRLVYDEFGLKCRRLQAGMSGPDGKTYTLEDVQLLPCVCEGKTGPLRIDADRVEWSPGGDIWLVSPVFRLGVLPIVWLPKFSYPVQGRQTGFLLPEFGFSSALGGWLSEPLFLAPQPSWDLTLEAGFGAERGPLLGLEGRWVGPGRGRGQTNLDVIVDLARRPEGGALEATRPLVRGHLRGDHFFGGAEESVKLRIDAVSDPDYLRRFGPDLEVQRAERARSLMAWTGRHPSSALRYGSALLLFQDLRPETSRFYVPNSEFRRVSALSRHGPLAVRQRLLELRFDDIPRRFFSGDSPVLASGRISLSFHAGFDERQTRFVRADAVRRLDIVLLEVPTLGLEVRSELGLRLTGWASQAAAARGANWLLSQLRGERGLLLGNDEWVLSADLSHLLVPEVWTEGDREAYFVGDEVDLFGPAHQMRGRVSLELFGALGRSKGYLEMRLGSDLRSLRGRGGEGLSDLTLLAQVNLLDGEPLALNLSTRLDWSLIALRAEALFLTASFGKSGVYDLRLDWARFSNDLPRAYEVAPLELVPSPNVPAPDTGLRSWSSVDAFRLRAEAWAGPHLKVGAAGDLAFSEDPDPIQRLLAQATFFADCRCFQVEVYAGTSRDQGGFFGGVGVGVPASPP